MIYRESKGNLLNQGGVHPYGWTNYIRDICPPVVRVVDDPQFKRLTFQNASLKYIPERRIALWGLGNYPMISMSLSDKVA